MRQRLASVAALLWLAAFKWCRLATARCCSIKPATFAAAGSSTAVAAAAAAAKLSSSAAAAATAVAV